MHRLTSAAETSLLGGDTRSTSAGETTIPPPSFVIILYALVRRV